MLPPRSAVAVVFLVMGAGAIAAQQAPTATLLARNVRAGALLAAAPAPGAEIGSGCSSGIAGAVGSASASLQLVTAPTGHDVVWTLGTAAVWQGSTEASCEVRYEFPAAVAPAGRVVVDWLPGSSGNGAASLLVDLHDDGVVDAVGPGSWPVALGPSPLVVRVRAAVTASAGTVATGWFSTWNYTGSASATLVVRVVPDHAQVVATAPACSGAAPSFAVAPTFAGDLALAATFAAADELAVLVLGFAPAALPLPWSPGCTLAVTPDVPLFAVVGPERTTAWSLTVPAAARPATFHAQVLGLDLQPWTLTASAAFAATSP